MTYPTDHAAQELLASGRSLDESLGDSGTIIYMPQCDRLTYAKASTLVDHAVKEMARVYRRALDAGLTLFVNNRRVEAVDPTYSMPNARHTRLEELQAKLSRLIISKPVPIRLRERDQETALIAIKLYRLPIEDWSSLPRKTLRNDLKVFDGNTVSILRNDRELFAGAMAWLTTRHSVTNWYRVQIDFPGVLDEAFGVSANKQGVRLKGYVMDAIKDAIGEDITAINDDIKRFQAQQASTREPAKPSASEARAGEVDAFQSNPLVALTADEEAQLDDNLRGLALTLKRDDETEEQAFTRVGSSKYIIDFKHDDYWPFYDVKHRFGKIILTINTAHPFFGNLYDPVRKMEARTDIESDVVGATATDTKPGPILALDLLLLSLARTHSRLSAKDDETRQLLDVIRREWSETYRVQLTA